MRGQRADRVVIGLNCPRYRVGLGGRLSRPQPLVGNALRLGPRPAAGPASLGWAGRRARRKTGPAGGAPGLGRAAWAD